VNAFASLLAIEHDTGAKEVPLFFVQPPDGRRDWAETPRQTVLFRDMKKVAPRVLGFPIPNAGKRNPAKARAEGIVSGVFDTEWQWPGDQAWIEMKGYDARGRAGELSPNQISWGNRMHLMGKRVACFFDPVAAIEWLQAAGAPFSGRIGR
jgi:hypothetical protein